MKRQYKFHKAPTLDVDWKNEYEFATCSTDQTINVFSLEENEPLTTFQGHTDEVNAIKWDPSGEILASCSDDFTAKLWKMSQSTPVFNFSEHEKEIYAIEWSPCGPG